MNKTIKTIKGTILSTSLLLLQMFFTFWRTKLIITIYGTDINSIAQAANQIFAYLTLFESGVCAAYQYKMYSPYSQQCFKKLYSLYEGLCITMKKIGFKMLIFVFLVSLIYPILLASNSLPYIKSSFIFLLIGLRCALPYCLVVSKKNILIIEEKQYLVSTIDTMINILIIIVEIIMVKVLHLEIEFTLIAGCLIIVLSYYLYKIYVLRFWKSVLPLENKHYNISPSFEANAMTKDILVHQICGLANSNIDILILSAVDVFSVTVYSNYNSIMNYPVNIINGVIRNIRATIGLKFASNDANTYSLFREMLSLNIWCSGIVTAVFATMINDFMKVWLGEKYVLSWISVGLFSLLLLRRMIVEVVYSVRDANGLYKESKLYTLFTAISNSILSIILVRYFGINGLLLGTVISVYFIMDLGNNKLVFNKVFNKKMVIYRDILIIIIISILSVVLFNIMLHNILVVNDWFSFVIKTFVVTIFSTLIMTVFNIIVDKYFIQLIKRFLKIFKY
ncbi:lipopolysaccharide biosynthesis protein [Clostridium perfringens]|uniref:lipopolysaccharide biosynthesis protein n=1 Tax=Clostridium perfringens TaxID=1502 RepID=UPI0037EEDD6F|nr:hypothetical protein [Clostridium perfringens]